MNEIILFGELEEKVTSSCSSCSGCSDTNESSCSVDKKDMTSYDLTLELKDTIERENLTHKFSVEFRDINNTDLTNYPDVKALINLTFSFPILTINKKIKYMGPFDSNIVLKEFKETY